MQYKSIAHGLQPTQPTMDMTGFVAWLPNPQLSANRNGIVNNII